MFVKMSKKELYRTPEFEEFIPGFECETCYSWFVDEDSDNEWANIVVTKEFLDNYMSLIKADAYETEFRVKIK